MGGKNLIGGSDQPNNRALFGSQTALELKSTLFSRMTTSKKKENGASTTDTTRATRMINNESVASLNHGGASNAAIGGHLTGAVSPHAVARQNAAAGAQSPKSDAQIDSARQLRVLPNNNSRSPFREATQSGVLSGTGMLSH